jgi:MFS family permease
VIDVGGFTILARLADEAVLARMFAAFEAILTLGIAFGALLTPLVIDLLGIRGALVAVGLVAPIAVVACWAQLRRLNARLRVRDADIELLHHVPMLRALPQATIEQLAAALDHAEIAPGHAVFQQGERVPVGYESLIDGHPVARHRDHAGAGAAPRRAARRVRPALQRRERRLPRFPRRDP